MKYRFTLLLSFLIFSFRTVLSQCYTIPASVKPTTSGTYSNSVVYEAANNRYLFRCHGADSTIFSYYTNSGGALGAIKLEKGATSLWPSIYGGPSLFVASLNTTKFPYDAGVTYSAIVTPSLNVDTMEVTWKMRFSNGTNRDSVNYTYRIHISGKTLVIKTLAASPKCAGFDLDRSQNSTNCNIVPIPYFTGASMLETNGWYLTSFFDWERSNGSSVFAYMGHFTPLASTSGFYGQSLAYNTRSNGIRNILNETTYISASKNANDVMPNLTNPISSGRDSSANRIVFEDWRGLMNFPFKYEVSTFLSKLHGKGIKNLWYLMHSWQRATYDQEYPDVLPANAACSGNANLKEVSDSCHLYGYLFSLHENYVDFMRKAPSFTYTDCVINPQNNYQKVYSTYVGDTLYVMKPTKVQNYVSSISTQIHNTFNTDGLFLDVHSAGGLGSAVDYDASIPNSGKMIETIKLYRQNALNMKVAHGNGLISGEGRNHYLYVGYYDDFEAQINCAYNNSGDGYLQGIRMPLYVDFKLNKCHQQTPFHGVGYYERFFSRKDGSTPFWPQKNLDSSLIYIATEIAYGNGAHIPESDRPVDVFKVAKVEYEHTYKIYKWIYKACADSIRYNDNGTMITASKYISKYPAVFDSIKDPDFMSQVRINYNNGVIVYVNRNPFKTWQVNLATTTGTVDYHAKIGTKDSLFHGVTSMTNYTLPINSGWLVYLPASLTTGLDQLSENKPLVNCYPNPFSSETMFTITSKNSGTAIIEMFDINGRKVFAANKPLNSGTNTWLWNGCNTQGNKCAKGIYIANVVVNGERTSIKVVLQ